MSEGGLFSAAPHYIYPSPPPFPSLERAASVVLDFLAVCFRRPLPASRHQIPRNWDNAILRCPGIAFPNSNPSAKPVKEEEEEDSIPDTAEVETRSRANWNDSGRRRRWIRRIEETRSPAMAVVIAFRAERRPRRLCCRLFRLSCGAPSRPLRRRSCRRALTRREHESDKR